MGVRGGRGERVSRNLPTNPLLGFPPGGEGTTERRGRMTFILIYYNILLSILIFLSSTDFSATRVHLTMWSYLAYIEEPSTRCSFTYVLLKDSNYLLINLCLRFKIKKFCVVNENYRTSSKRGAAVGPALENPTLLHTNKNI